ncbi:MAG: hypothetical protein VB071_05510 [Lawsonibacter sp.]|nr:hypothetical protein [Lawsonibacter sp.]
MNWSMRFFILLFCFFLLLAGCHGGSGGGDAPPDGGSAEASASSASQSAGQDNPEESGDSSNSGETDPAAVLTLAETVTFLKHLSPQVLGLAGTSMDSYQIYPAESMVLVNGACCTKLSVFSVDSESGTNRFQGVYLLTRDKKHLYSLEQRTSKVTELALPGESTSF